MMCPLVAEEGVEDDLKRNKRRATRALPLPWMEVVVDEPSQAGYL